MTTWNIGNKAINSLTINNKEVRSIVRVSDGVTIYQKPSTPVVTVGNIELIGTKSILSSYNNEYSDITATVYDDSAIPQPIANQQVVFKNGSTVLATETTGPNGECTYRYNSSGVGNVTITAECDNVSDTLVIEDIYKYVQGNDSTPISSSLTSYSLAPMTSVSPTITSDGTNIVLTSPNSSNSWQRGDLSFLNGLDNFEMSMITKNPFGFQLNDGSNMQFFTSESRWIVTPVNNNAGWVGETVLSLTSTDEYILKIKIKGKRIVLKIYSIDGTELISANKTMDYNMNRFGFCWTKSNTFKFRDLKVRQLVSSVGSVDSVILTGDKSVLSFKHDDECVLIATVYDGSSTPVPLGDKVVNFKIGSNVIGSAVTDSNGEAEYIYHSRGANNITITAQCETESDTFSIEDNWVYLTGVTDYSPNWLVHNNSTASTYYLLTTENDKYKLVKSGTDRSELGLQVHPVMDFGLKSFEITASFYWTADNVGSYNNLWHITDKTGWINSIQLGTWSSSKILGYVVNGTNKRSNPSGRLSAGTWYIFKAKYDPENSNIYSAIINKSSGNIVAETNSTDIFPVVPCMLRWNVYYSASNNYLDEVKVKSLTTQTDNYNIDVTGDAEILSAYDNDTMTVTVTVTDVDGEPVANQSVELFYQGETHATSTTNSNGVATFTYTATGFGYASVYAYVGTNAGKYDFIDAKYYASNLDIQNGLNILPYPLQNWDRIHFRFHSLPNHTIIGIGNSSTSDYVLEKNGDTYKYHRNPSGVSSTGTPSSAHAFEVGKDYIFIKNNKTSPSRTEIFKNNTYVDWWTSGNSANRIRIDKYANDDFNIEVFVL